MNFKARRNCVITLNQFHFSSTFKCFMQTAWLASLEKIFKTVSTEDNFGTKVLVRLFLELACGGFVLKMHTELLIGI